MSTPNAKTPAELFDDFIKLEWQEMFRKEVHVRLDNGTRYVPNGGSQGVQLLRKDVNAFDKAIRIWSGPTGEPDSGTQGYDRIVEQAGVEYTWEWFLIEPSRPWASAVPPLVRERIEADLNQRRDKAVSNAQARVQKTERDVAQEDDKMIASLNAKRIEEGKDRLTEKQEAFVRDRRQSRRAES
jgi:hypothetical protein